MVEPGYDWRGQDEWTPQEEIDYQLYKIENEGFDYYLVRYTSNYSPVPEIQEAFTLAADHMKYARDLVRNAIYDFVENHQLEDSEVYF